MKRKTTKEILAESFRELAADRAIDKITVQEIVSNCAYSSATFYRHFKDKYDLIAWDYAQKAAEIMDRLNEKDYLWGQVLLDWAAYFQQEKEYLMNLLLHTSGHDAFIRYMTEINTDAFTNYLQSHSGRNELDEKTSMLIRAYCLGSVCLTCEWISGKYNASVSDLAAIYENAMPLTLQEMLS